MELSDLNIEQYVDIAIQYCTLYGFKILGALAIFIIGKWISKRITKVAKKVLVRSTMDKTLVAFFESIIYIILMVVARLAHFNP